MKEKQLSAFDKKSKEIYQYNGWASSKEYKPPKYDLVLCKDERGKEQRGWWTGFLWEFGKRRIGNPLYWRRELEYFVDKF